MAYQITQEQYRDEWVVQFQRGATYLRDCVTTEMMIRGNEAVFPIQGSAPRMVTRGVNGQIPARQRTDSQVRVTLKERHTLEEQTSFNIFTAHANLREAMQNSGALTAHREIDDEIISALTTATNDYADSPVVLTFNRMLEIIAALNTQNVYFTDSICCVWTPMAWARLKSFAQNTSVDFVNRKRLAGNTDLPFNWLGAMHMLHTGLPGSGTADAECFAFAKPAMGHAINQGDIRTSIGYDDKQDASYARHTIFHGSVVLQQSGLLKIPHDDAQAIAS